MSENYEIGRKFYNEKEYDKALEYFQLAAENGYVKAYSFIGDAYNLGKGVEQDSKKAYEYYKLSIKNQDPTAYFELGKLFYKGIDDFLPSSIPDAIDCFFQSFKLYFCWDEKIKDI